MPCNENPERKYWERASEIKLTVPFFLTEMIGKAKRTTDYNSFINKFYAEHIQGQVQIANNVVKYTELNFADFDEFLWKETKKDFCE